MNKYIELPLVEPIYSTYHYQGAGSAIIFKNPSIRNWYLNEIMNLTCSRKFLIGFTSPETTILNSSCSECPYIEKIVVTSQFTDGYINVVIRKMIDAGYYVVFKNVDDYYVKGKSWYKERHFAHDGLICGYNQMNKTYCIYAYDSNWMYRKFWTPQRSFDSGRLATHKKGGFIRLYALKPKEEVVEFSPKKVYEKINEYLDSDIEKYPFTEEGRVYGIVVQEYIAEYVSKLERGDISYDKMDRRVFRLIWEHKKAMYERINLVEKSLGLSNTISEQYTALVKNADMMRMLYASHHMKRRDSVLPMIRKMIIELMQEEHKLLSSLLIVMERNFNNESVEVSKK